CSYYVRFPLLLPDADSRSAPHGERSHGGAPCENPAQPFENARFGKGNERKCKLIAVFHRRFTKALRVPPASGGSFANSGSSRRRRLLDRLRSGRASHTGSSRTPPRRTASRRAGRPGNPGNGDASLWNRPKPALKWRPAGSVESRQAAASPPHRGTGFARFGSLKRKRTNFGNSRRWGSASANRAPSNPRASPPLLAPA